TPEPMFALSAPARLPSYRFDFIQASRMARRASEASGRPLPRWRASSRASRRRAAHLLAGEAKRRGDVFPVLGRTLPLGHGPYPRSPRLHERHRLQIADEHGSSVKVESEPGKGTRFEFKIPVGLAAWRCGSASGPEMNRAPFPEARPAGRLRGPERHR